ncbi:MAG: hypothetical protein ACE5F1_22670, partial [Planctomycetota bacterium]
MSAQDSEPLWFDPGDLLDDDSPDGGFQEHPESWDSSGGEAEDSKHGDAGDGDAGGASADFLAEFTVDPFDTEEVDNELFRSLVPEDESLDWETSFLNPGADGVDPESDDELEEDDPEELDLDASLWSSSEQEFHFEEDPSIESPLAEFYQDLAKETGDLDADPLFADETRDSSARQKAPEEPPAAEFQDVSGRERFRRLPPIRMSEVRSLDW